MGVVANVDIVMLRAIIKAVTFMGAVLPKEVLKRATSAKTFPVPCLSASAIILFGSIICRLSRICDGVKRFERKNG